MAVKTMTLGPGKLTLGEEKEIAAQLTKCTLVPSVSKEKPTPVLSGENVPGKREEAFNLKGTIYQDFGEDDSLTEWLWTNRGTEQAFTFEPRTGKKKVKGTLIVEAIDIGGGVGDILQSDFDWELTSPPTIAS